MVREEGGKQSPSQQRIGKSITHERGSLFPPQANSTKKQNTPPPLRRTSAATVPNAIVSHCIVVSPLNPHCFLLVNREKRRRGAIINLSRCSYVVTLLLPSVTVHRTGHILFPWCKENLPCCRKAIYRRRFLKGPLKLPRQEGRAPSVLQQIHGDTQRGDDAPGGWFDVFYLLCRMFCV